jgi:glucokinase
MNTEVPLLGLDIGGTYVRAAVGLGPRIIVTKSAPWPYGLSPTEDLDFIAGLALDLIDKTGTNEPVQGAGVSLAALLDEEGRVADWPNRPQWRQLAFRSLMESRLAMPIVVEDDANATALAEWRYGAGRGYRHLLVMAVGTGTGAGLILDGFLYRGAHGWAGELGHLSVMPDGPACPCGNRGCLQMMASGRALEEIAERRGLSGVEALVIAAKEGETWAVEALSGCGRWLGFAAANMVNLLDLEAVIVGGGLSVLGPPFWSTLSETLQAGLLNPAHREVALHRAALADKAGVLGAITLAQQLINPHGSRP